MLKQSLQHKLLQKLSPQQIQLMKLIQLPTQAFEERLKQEIEENPALDTEKRKAIVLTTSSTMRLTTMILAMKKLTLKTST